MLPFRSIKSLYSLALAQGEGLGTAYEYFAKRLVLAPWLARLPRPQRLLIAGLPEKFGYSLDLLLLAQEMIVRDVVVIDERPSALEGIRQSVAAAQAAGELTRLQPRYLLVTEMDRMNELIDHFDLCLAFGVLQRLDTVARRRYVRKLANLAPAIALFASNADDISYKTLGGSPGLTLTEFRALIEPLEVLESCGYVDIPPWPPGVERSTAQRQRATTGRFEAVAMGLLEQYARLERFLPSQWRKRQSHNMYAFVRRLNGGTARI